MAPRGLKKLLKTTAPAAFVKGKFAGFVQVVNGVRSGNKLRGLTRALESGVWSKNSTLPSIAKYSAVKRGGWKGPRGGRQRGAAVDAQLSLAVNAGVTKPKSGQYTLTKLALAALAEQGLEPVVSQRAVCNDRLRIGTAADVICFEKSSGKLVVVELKCNGGQARTAPAEQRNGQKCRMLSPLGRASDHTLNRHFAQLACTLALFVREERTLEKLCALGVSADVGAGLLYVNDELTEFYDLPKWWVDRGDRILNNI
jgi:hypothetical protein